MSYKIIITGATGWAGTEALRQALLHPQISHVACLTRSPISSTFTANPKLKVIQHQDFAQYDEGVLQELRGYDGVIWDLGITGVRYKVSEATYKAVTITYPLTFARAISSAPSPHPLDPSKKFVFAFLTNLGADEEASTDAPFHVRIRGEAEKALTALRDELPLATYIFRPGAIIPISPVPEAPTKVKLASYLLPLLRPFTPSYLIDSDVLASGMINSIIGGSGGEIEGWEGKGVGGNEGVFENEEIKKLAAVTGK